MNYYCFLCIIATAVYFFTAGVYWDSYFELSVALLNFGLMSSFGAYKYRGV